MLQKCVQLFKNVIHLGIKIVIKKLMLDMSRMAVRENAHRH